MRPNALKKKLADGARCVGGWAAIPSAFSTEIYAAQGWDYVTLDMQHGSILDAGAYGIICPMINSKAEAEALVRAGLYPPLGERSFGPFRAAQYGGADYWQHANDEVLLLAMIETRQAVSNLPEILSVKGLNGVYIGPSDLSFSMGKTPTLDPSDETVLKAMGIILKETRERGLIAGVHTDGPKTARKRFAEGFQFCTILNDVRLLATAAANAVREARGQDAAAAAKTY
jgi:4-hydroxy-2-oxoheptanedioate aldolase